MEFLPEGVADALDALEIILARSRHNVAGELHDGLRSRAVGAYFEGIFPFKLKEQSDVLKSFG